MHFSNTEKFSDQFDDLFDQAATHAGPHDPVEVIRYATNLSPMEGLDFDADVARVAHIRSRQVASSRASPRRRVETSLEECATGPSSRSTPIRSSTICFPEPKLREAEGLPRSVWVRTTAMPVTNPGVVDLAVEYRSIE